jgi:hypothetical protein
MKISVQFDNGPTIDFTRFRGRLTHRNIKRQYTQEVADRIFKMRSDDFNLTLLLRGVKHNQMMRKYKKELKHQLILKGVLEYYSVLNRTLMQAETQKMKRKD